MSTALDLALLAASWTHVFLAPYTKVEESFNLHATHDVLFYGVEWASLPKYDHFVFPGAVPRTFVGSILLAWVSTPFLRFAQYFDLLVSKSDIQVAIRLVLATCNVAGFAYWRRSVADRYGRKTSLLFVLITICQFHLPFWMGRTLPNMFALLPVNIALCKLWKRAKNATKPTPAAIDIAIALMVFSGVVFRAEVAILLASTVAQILLSGWAPLKRVIKVGLISAAVSIVLTVIVDSYFWQQWPLWPELYGLYFNVIQGKSSEWGVSPFYAYFTTHLPKLLLASLPLVLIGAITDHRIRSLLIPSISFVFLLSFLGHKEWRFLVYVIPVFNVAAAQGAAYLTTRKLGTIWGRLGFLLTAGCIGINLCATIVWTVSSSQNYPGGDAMARFNEMYAQEKHVHVHISNLAAQTGASLFQQVHTPPYPPWAGNTALWIYNKTENVTPAQLTANRQITHAIAEIAPSNAANSFDGTRFPRGSWKLTGVVESFDGLSLDMNALKRGLTEAWQVLKFVKSEKLAILERAGRRRI
ncbi:glycosyltransferase family 22 protein [Phlebiopsis gigantea 11061_1 CR5-6]|uniref:Mannosyltransferase n=1 Tax=Phlebiopsis gigantea (strain 11061_1 CR5-6) TaxID=745531 RepID=A0A0C3S667_PHLG1|nr:glycosyltransferase family 22 protein [Phlebiopsis gigantea 11061_1 CR5-6]